MNILRLVGVAVLLTLLPGPLSANGILRRGSGGAATALGGATVADQGSPLAAMWSNPATLASFHQPTAELGYFGAYGDATFTNDLNGPTDLRRPSGHGAEFALAYPLPNRRGVIGLSLIPEAALVGDWRYLDNPGGTDGTVTYGSQRHRSRFVAVRTALGLGWQVNDRLSVGASVGVVYDRIDLEVPYIFQQTPGLAGFKTLLDMETDGLSWNGDLGMHLRLRDNLHLGLRYRSATDLDSGGRALGEAGAQLAALGPLPPRTDFRYDADVSLSIPEIFSAGLAWEIDEQWQLNTQVDWIPWGDHFNTMRVSLANGDNPDLPDAIVDQVPLGWDDRFVFRAGLEYELNPCWIMRAGYSYTPNPIPSSNVTPLNASISEHSVAFGLGYHGESWSVDLGYQLDIRNTESVGASVYQAGEYSDSSVSLLTHWWALSTTFRF